MHAGWSFWPIFPLFWIGLLLFFGWGARRFFGARERYRKSFERPFNRFPDIDALEILRRRYALGEIDGMTFDHMRERLEGSARVHD